MCLIDANKHTIFDSFVLILSFLLNGVLWRWDISHIEKICWSIFVLLVLLQTCLQHYNHIFLLKHSFPNFDTLP